MLDRVLLVAALAATPLHRGAIPLGLALGLGPWGALIATLAGEAVAILLLLVFFDRLHRRFSRSRLFRRLESRSEGGKRTVNTYGALGLALFVTVPVPGTGYWVAAAIAFLTGMDRRAALAAIVAGTVAAELALLGALMGVGGVLGWWR
jgi:uncharacterized membrane protein